MLHQSRENGATKLVINPENDGAPFPVVGIGASAGGLRALENFFQSIPPAPGMAFVIITHLAPDRKSLLNEILARHTTLKSRSRPR